MSFRKAKTAWKWGVFGHCRHRSRYSDFAPHALTARTRSVKNALPPGLSATIECRNYRDVTIIRNIIAAIAVVALCADLSGCGSSVQAAEAAKTTAPSDLTSSPNTWTAVQNFTAGVQVNMLGIGAPAGAASAQVQFLQQAPGPTIQEISSTGNSGQVATLWAAGAGEANFGDGLTFGKQLELCLDVAASDCAGETIPGAPGDGHLWSFATLHVIGFNSIEFENQDQHLASLSSAGLASLVPVVLPVSTVAGLPTCDSGLKGGMAAVSDAADPAYNAPLTGGGTASIPVYCNGNAWTAH